MLYDNRMDLFERARIALQEKGHTVYAEYGLEGVHMLVINNKAKIIFIYTGKPEASILEIRGSFQGGGYDWSSECWLITEEWSKWIDERIENLLSWLHINSDILDREFIEWYRLNSNNPIDWIRSIINGVYGNNYVTTDNRTYTLYGSSTLTIFESKDKVGFILDGVIKKKSFVYKNEITQDWLNEFKNILILARPSHSKVIPQNTTQITSEESTLTPGQQFIYDTIKNAVEQVQTGIDGLAVEQEYRFSLRGKLSGTVIIKVSQDGRFSLVTPFDFSEVEIPFKQYFDFSEFIIEIEKIHFWHAI